eukprot:gene17839-biopygen6663
MSSAAALFAGKDGTRRCIFCNGEHRTENCQTKMRAEEHVSRHEEALEIYILIGANYYWMFQIGDVIRGGQHEPVAIKTTLGWTLSGPVNGEFVDSDLVHR